MSVAEKISFQDQNTSPIFKNLIGVVIVGIFCVLLKWSAPVLNPILFAAFLAALAAPFYFWIQKKGLGGGLSLIVLLLTLILGALFFLGLGYFSILSLQSSLSNYTIDTAALQQNVSQLLSSLGINSSSSAINQGLSNFSSNNLLSTILKYAVSLIENLLYAFVLVLFLLIDSKRIIGLAKNQLKDRPVFGDLPEIAHTVVTYFKVRTVVNLVTGLSFFVLLLLLGVDYAFLWGILAFILSYVPYIGLFTAMVPPTIIAYAEHGLWSAIAVIIGGFILNMAAENILEPNFAGKTLKLSPVVVLAGFFIGAWLMGPTGALVSMPVVVTIMLVTRKDKRTAWVADLLGSAE